LTNSTDTSPSEPVEAAEKCPGPCCPCNITVVKKLASVVPGGFECTGPTDSDMHECTTASLAVDITFPSNYGWEVVAVRFVYEMPVPPFGIGIALASDVEDDCPGGLDKCLKKKRLTGSIELEYFTSEVFDPVQSPATPPPPAPPPIIDEYCRKGLMGLIGRPCVEWDAAGEDATCPVYLQKLNRCMFRGCCTAAAVSVSQRLAEASSVANCKRFTSCHVLC